MIETRVVSVARKLAEGIVVKHLRPAPDETLADLRKVAPKFAGVAIDQVPSVMRASADLRRAYVALEDLQHRYATIRAARRQLFELGYRPTVDDGTFAEFLSRCVTTSRDAENSGSSLGKCKGLRSCHKSVSPPPL